MNKKVIELNTKFNTEYTNKLLNNWHIFNEIYEKCNLNFDKGCGSYLFDGITYDYCDSMYEKQELLFNKVKTATNVLEIGTYMGHSIFIMLLSNPNLHITCIDIDDKYTEPSIKLLNKYFNNNITFIKKPSLEALNNIIEKFDFFHIDGHHENTYIEKEFIKIIELNNNKNNILRVVFDDQNCMTKLQNKIEMSYTIIKKTIPMCKWNNIYYEIQL
jgi:hypothetical protein